MFEISRPKMKIVSHLEFKQLYLIKIIYMIRIRLLQDLLVIKILLKSDRRVGVVYLHQELYSTL
jgi:hypothetical protein